MPASADGKKRSTRCKHNTSSATLVLEMARLFHKVEWEDKANPWAWPQRQGTVACHHLVRTLTGGCTQEALARPGGGLVCSQPCMMENEASWLQGSGERLQGRHREGGGVRNGGTGLKQEGRADKPGWEEQLEGQEEEPGAKCGWASNLWWFRAQCPPASVLLRRSEFARSHALTSISNHTPRYSPLPCREGCEKASYFIDTKRKPQYTNQSCHACLTGVSTNAALSLITC